MEPAMSAAKSEQCDLFQALGLLRKPYRLSERQVYVELHPSNSGPLAMLSKAPVLAAQDLTVTITPDDSCPAGARIEVEIGVDGIDVISTELNETDKERIKHKIGGQLLHSQDFPKITFQVQDIAINPDGTTALAKGLLRIRGRTAEQWLRFRKTRPLTYESSFEICQSAFGLTPLTAMMGGLRSDDKVSIRLLVYLGKEKCI